MSSSKNIYLGLGYSLQCQQCHCYKKNKTKTKKHHYMVGQKLLKHCWMSQVTVHIVGLG